MQEKINIYLEKFMDSALGNVLSCIGILVFGYLVSKYLLKIVRRMMEKANFDRTLQSFLLSVFQTIARLFIFLTALSSLGVGSTSIIAIFTTLGAAVSLGLKDSLSHLASGILILVNKPFKVGDWIEVDNVSGSVKAIQIFHTVLNTIDNQRVIVPNGSLVNDIIINETGESRRRLQLEFRIDYLNDYARVRDIISKIVINHRFSIKSEAPVIKINKISDNKVTIMLRVWCQTSDYYTLKFELLEEIYSAFKQENILFAHDEVNLYSKEVC